MSRIVALLIVASAIGASAAVNYNPVSFCQRYSAAVNAASETALITAVISRALNGNLTVTPSVTGILNQDLQKQYFNGTRNGGTNFYTNTAARTTLVAALINFFSAAMGCREVTTTALANMKTVHASLKIDKAAWDQFVGEVVNTLLSLGVPNVAGAGGEITYAAALLGQFKRGGAGEICSDATCDTWTDFAEFTTGDDGATTPNKMWLAADGTSAVKIAVNGYIHWNIGSIHNLVQTDSSYTDLAGGFTSGAVGAMSTWTRQFTTDGTYYFVCNPHRTTMRGKIVVGTGGSGAAGVTASLAVVLAAITAAFALKF